jgi:hypothetical protein
MFDELARDARNIIRTITATLGSVLSIITALSFLSGFAANSQSIGAIIGFLACWGIFSVLTDELDSVLKKTLASLGIPHSLSP